MHVPQSLYAIKISSDKAKAYAGHIRATIHAVHYDKSLWPSRSVLEELVQVLEAGPAKWTLGRIMRAIKRRSIDRIRRSSWA